MKDFKAKMASILEKALVKFHLRPKDFVSERRSKQPVSEESSNHGGDLSEDSEHRSDEPRPPTTILGKRLLKLLHLRPKERVSEGSPKELVPEEGSEVGGASEINVEQHREDRRPPTALEKCLIKLRLRPKERISEGQSKDLVSEEFDSEESNRNGGASEEHGGQHRSEETRPPTLLGKSPVKLHLGPKEDVSEGRSKELVSEESSKDAGAYEGNGKQNGEEARPPTMLEKGLVKLHLRPKERLLEGSSRETLSEEGSKEGGASEKNDEQCSKRRPPEVHILNETGPTAVVLHGLPDAARTVNLPVRLGFTVLEAESSIEYYDLMLQRKFWPKIPVNSECPECKAVPVIAYLQRFRAQGLRFDKGEHTIDVAWTLPSDLTPSSQTFLGTITYDFCALVNTTRGEKIYSAWQPLLVKRYIRPHPRKSFNKVFPTPRSAVVTVTTVPQTIYPTGEFPVHLRLTNIKTPERDVSGKLCYWRWFLHKVSWSIIEKTTWVSEGCRNHTPRCNLFRRIRPLVDNDAFDMRTTYEDCREIGSGVFYEGWMTNFACPGYGKIDFDFSVSINLGDAPVSSFRTWNEEHSVEHFLSIEMMLHDDMTGDLIGPVIPPQRLRVLSQLNVEEDNAKSVNWDEVKTDISGVIGDSDSDEQSVNWDEIKTDKVGVMGDSDSDELSAAVPPVHSSISPDNDQGGKEAGEDEGGDSWFVPGKPNERGRPTYEFVGRGSRDQSLVGRQQVPLLELEEGAGSTGVVDEEVFRPIIPDV